MLTLASASTDRKPDFDLTDVAAGDVVTLQLAQDLKFRKGLTSYTITVDTAGFAAGFENFAATALKRGTWYARAKIGAGGLSNVVVLNIV